MRKKKKIKILIMFLVSVVMLLTIIITASILTTSPQYYFYSNYYGGSYGQDPYYEMGVDIYGEYYLDYIEVFVTNEYGESRSFYVYPSEYGSLYYNWQSSVEERVKKVIVYSGDSTKKAIDEDVIDIVAPTVFAPGSILFISFFIAGFVNLGQYRRNKLLYKKEEDLIAAGVNTKGKKEIEIDEMWQNARIEKAKEEILQTYKKPKMNDKYVLCEYCGAENEIDNKHCDACGAKLRRL